MPAYVSGSFVDAIQNAESIYSINSLQNYYLTALADFNYLRIRKVLKYTSVTEMFFTKVLLQRELF